MTAETDWLDVSEPTEAELFFDDVHRPPADLLTREFPPREYAILPYYPTKCCSTLVAEGGTGKSTEAIKQCLHVAAGIPYNGLDVMQGTSLFYSMEDEPDEVWRRVQRIVRRMPVEAQQPALDNFVLINRVGRRKYFVITTRGGTPAITKTVDALAEYIVKNFPRTKLVVVDTISRVNGASENGNEAMACVVDAGERIAQATEAAVVLLHHTSKAGARDGVDDLHAGRGGSALGDNCRSVLRLMPATDAHCKGFDVPKDARERGDILRLVHAKVNYHRKADVQWLRRQTDGTLEPFEPEKLDATTRDEWRLEVFVKWLADYGKPVNKRTVRDLRADIWADDRLSQPAVRDLYDRAIDEGHLIDSDESRNGRVLQMLNPATAERIVLEAKEIEDKFNVEDEP